MKRIIVFGRIPNPTFDYYLAARLDAPDMPPYEVADIRGGEALALEADGALVILCRYASPLVLRWIEQNAERLSGVGLFLDDDIAAVVTGKDANFFYRLSLCYLALWPLRELSRHLDFVWASTPHLASRLADAKAVVLPPAPPKPLWEAGGRDEDQHRQSDGDVLIGYHATGVHLTEHQFLRPIIADVLRERPQARFEVFADRRANRIWQGLERVRIREPLPWTEYVADAKARRIDIMLVPLAPSHVNDSRSPTKRIDVARYGAAGMFSQGAVYGASADTRELLLPYVEEVWRHHILQLIDDQETRRVLAHATKIVVLQMTAAADRGLGSLMRRNA
ncbi:hypothetical protein IB267_32030 [Ensifer sp. ENS09]|uniref:hypothetical protein n=1 Tax=Ensifer sp. ENS09 TaxID=2769263 RepID=UPI00177F60A3|nr:hypothetical protein [Ensifer sp. ENS09]MBD9652997.1 hypothetical protein [Ensifer sp. ENS09]